MTKGEARKIAAGIAKLPELLLKPRDEKHPALASLAGAMTTACQTIRRNFRAGHEPKIQERDFGSLCTSNPRT